MKISADAIAQGVTTGVAASLFFWGFGFLKDKIRDYLLRRSIKKELRRVGMGHNLQGVTVSVSNHLQRAFTIKEVHLELETGELAFNATSTVESSEPDPRMKLTRQENAMVKRGEPIRQRTITASRQWIVNPDHAGFAEVKPFTRRTFVLPANLIIGDAEQPTAIRMTIEYETWTKKIRILRERNGKSLTRQLQNLIASYRESLLNGKLNEIRLAFGLPALRVAEPPRNTPPNMNRSPLTSKGLSDHGWPILPEGRPWEQSSL